MVEFFTRQAVEAGLARIARAEVALLDAIREHLESRNIGAALDLIERTMVARAAGWWPLPEETDDDHID